jgi:hypothetical protein
MYPKYLSIEPHGALIHSQHQQNRFYHSGQQSKMRDLHIMDLISHH